MGYDLNFAPKDVQSLYRRFIMGGFSKEEAGNLVAYMVLGLHASTRGWTIKEIKDIIFLREVEKTLPP